MTREPGRAPPRHAHGDLTSLAPHEHKLHLEACYMMSPALRNHLPEFPYQLSTKKLNLLCDFGFSWSTLCLPSWDYTGQSHLRVGWWYLLCALAALHAFSSQPLHCCTVYVYTSPLPTHYELLEDLDSHLFSSFCSLDPSLFILSLSFPPSASLKP